jgi:hypothetical protein
MSIQNLKTSQSPSLRAKQLKTIINQLKRKIQKIELDGEVAPPNCHLIRYQVTQNQKIYWYYKLQASSAIFDRATSSQKKTKYLYLGKAGSEAHVEAVKQMSRRNLIDELEKMINSLTEAYLDICLGGETEADPSYFPEGRKND